MSKWLGWLLLAVSLQASTQGLFRGFVPDDNGTNLDATASTLAAPAAPSFVGTTITIASWGGAYTSSQIEAYHKPYTAKTGIKINSVEWDGSLGGIRSQVKSGDIKWDVIDVEGNEADVGCQEGLLERIDPDVLPPGADGRPAAKDFLPGTVLPCAIGTIIYSNVIAYDKGTVGSHGPKTLDDFFDLNKFPGKRALKKDPSVALEWALMADGVNPSDVYKALGTSAGVDRALNKLNSIKGSIVWWTAGAQPPQLLASGQVVMAHSWHGRIVDSNARAKTNFDIIWDGQVQNVDYFAILKGGKNTAASLEFVRFATSTQPLSDQSKYIPYSPVRVSSLYAIPDSNPNKAWLPTFPRLGRSLVSNTKFWIENGNAINKRFELWLRQ